MTHLILVPRNVYGRDLFYPDCSYSHELALLVRCKGFTQAQVDALKRLGYQIEFKPGVSV